MERVRARPRLDEIVDEVRILKMDSVRQKLVPARSQRVPSGVSRTWQPRWPTPS